MKQILTFTTFVALSMAFLSSSSVLIAAGPSELETAQRVDSQLVTFFNEEGAKPTPLANDEDFLRRITLDLAGTIPSPKDATLFGIDPNPNKRKELIDELLRSPAYAQLWGRYWREVVTSRATEARVRLAVPAFEKWLIEQFEQNRPWDEITREMLTATGSVSEEGATGLIFSHTGQPQELAAEVSRIFMGIQMSCANCHDHPTDSWKREQFHELAAFFPRLTVRRTEPNNIRSFAVMSYQAPRRQRGQDFSPERLFQGLDRNRDGEIEKSEARGPLSQRFDTLLATIDKNKNGKLSLKEFQEARRPANNVQPGRGESEYYMPDLDDPSSKGTLTEPAFFISEVNANVPSTGTDDLDRRDALADLVTAKSNPWFARAFVNRMWSEMLGQGFYMPIDDMGPERFASFEPVLETLANGFAENDYDVKWLMRTIANTKAYQRSMVSAGGELPSVSFAAAEPTRLRSDQIYNSFIEVLGAGDLTRQYRGQFRNNRQVSGRQDPARTAFSLLFNYDASTPQADIIGNVPQALFMMNSPQLEQFIRANGSTRLSRLLSTHTDDDDALSELYLLVLTREPSDRERTIAQKYIATSETRSTAYEDLMWSLMNSTEFLSKR